MAEPENENGNLSAALLKLADRMQELTTETRALRSELKTQREKKVSTRRVKTTRTAKRLQDVPVDDIAAAAARRTLAKLGRM